jgi:uncharacterized membrane protein YbhN (UPF0104 family)
MARLREIVGSTWFKAALSVALLVLLLASTDTGQLTSVVVRAEPAWVVLALLGYLGSQLLSVVRWAMLARPLGFAEPFGRYFVCYFSGMYLNLFAPSTVAGDVGRALFLAGPGRRALAFTSVLADRALGFVALTWVAAIAVLSQPSLPMPAVVYHGAWLLPPLTLAAWIFGPRLCARVLPPANKWRLLVERDLAPYWGDWALLMRTIAVAMVFHVVQVVTQIMLAWALHLSAPASFFWIFVPVVNVLGMLPITFSGVGIREGGYVIALASVGVDRESGVALGLLSSAVVLTTGVLSGIVFLANKTPVVMPAGDAKAS